MLRVLTSSEHKMRSSATVGKHLCAFSMLAMLLVRVLWLAVAVDNSTACVASSSALKEPASTNVS